MGRQHAGDFNPRAPRGARPAQPRPPPRQGNFNPRAPRGARQVNIWQNRMLDLISIHAPLAGRDYAQGLWSRDMVLFQSTRPSRGATVTENADTCQNRNFNPRAPRGARHDLRRQLHRSQRFQSTRPSRGATAGRGHRQFHLRISLHAPLAGRDLASCRTLLRCIYFNPRAPRGARLKHQLINQALPYFNPRAPRGARLPTPL